MSYRGEPTSLDGASGCEISGPPDLFQIDCNWAMAGDLAAAQYEHARIKAALEPCLSGAFVLQDYETTVEGLEVLQYFKGKFAGDADQAGEVSLEIQHYAKIDGSYSVILSISR